MIAEEAVRLGYRAATPLDLDADLDDAVGPGSEPHGWSEQSGEAKSLKEIAIREGIDNS